MNMKNTSRTLAFLGIFGALALVLSFLENLLLPDLPLLPPGAKLGLSNIVITLCASLLGLPSAFYITLLKALFALVTRGAAAGFMSLSGGLLSTLVLVFLLKRQGKSVTFLGIGVLCAALHNFGQLLAAMALTGTLSLWSYGKYLLLFSLLTGTLTGLMLNLLTPRLNDSFTHLTSNI